MAGLGWYACTDAVLMIADPGFIQATAYRTRWNIASTWSGRGSMACSVPGGCCSCLGNGGVGPFCFGSAMRGTCAPSPRGAFAGRVGGAKPHSGYLAARRRELDPCPGAPMLMDMSE